MIVNNCPVVISVEHVTIPEDGFGGSTLIAVCSTLEEVNTVLNDPAKQPPILWQWKVDFQDDLE